MSNLTSNSSIDYLRLSTFHEKKNMAEKYHHDSSIPTGIEEFCIDCCSMPVMQPNRIGSYANSDDHVTKTDAVKSNSYVPSTLKSVEYQMALKALKNCQNCVQAPVFVIGLAHRLPGVESSKDIWQWHKMGCSHAQRVGLCGNHMRWPKKLFAHDIPMETFQNEFSFDAEYWNMSEYEARNSNPLLSFLLEVISECIFDSGLGFEIESSTKKTGIYLAVSSDMDGYITSQLSGSYLTVTSSQMAVLLGGIFKSKGPSVSVDANFCSSVAALHRAITDLQRSVVHYAIVAGANMVLNPNAAITVEQLKDMSGWKFIQSDGVAAILLARDRDLCHRIYALVPGVDIVSDSSVATVGAIKEPESVDYFIVDSQDHSLFPVTRHLLSEQKEVTNCGPVEGLIAVIRTLTDLRINQTLDKTAVVINRSLCQDLGFIILRPYKFTLQQPLQEPSEIQDQVLVPFYLRHVNTVEPLLLYIQWACRTQERKEILKLICHSLMITDRADLLRGYVLVNLGPDPGVILHEVKCGMLGEFPPKVCLVFGDCFAKPLSKEKPSTIDIVAFRKSVMLSEQILKASGQSMDGDEYSFILDTVVYQIALVDLFTASMIEVYTVGLGMGVLAAAYCDGCLTRYQCLQCACCLRDFCSAWKASHSEDYSVLLVEMTKDMVYTLGPRITVLAIYSETLSLIGIETQKRATTMDELIGENDSEHLRQSFNDKDIAEGTTTQLEFAKELPVMNVRHRISETEDLTLMEATKCTSWEGNKADGFTSNIERCSTSNNSGLYPSSETRSQTCQSDKGIETRLFEVSSVKLDTRPDGLESLIKAICNKGGSYHILPTTPFYNPQMMANTKLESLLKSIIIKPAFWSENSLPDSFITDISPISHLLCNAEHLVASLSLPVNHPATIRSCLEDPSVVIVAQMSVSVDISQGFFEDRIFQLAMDAASLLTLFGKLHMKGGAVKVDSLNALESVGPADCSAIPMSHLVSWNHTKAYPLPEWTQLTFQEKDEIPSLYRFHLMPEEKSKGNLLGLLLYHAWLAIESLHEDKNEIEMTPVQFMNLILHCKPDFLHCTNPFYLHAHVGRKVFQIFGSDKLVISGGFDLSFEEEVDKPSPLIGARGYNHWKANTNWRTLLKESLPVIESITKGKYITQNQVVFPHEVTILPRRHRTVTLKKPDLQLEVEEYTGICRIGGITMKFLPGYKLPISDESLPKAGGHQTPISPDAGHYSFVWQADKETDSDDFDSVGTSSDMADHSGGKDEMEKEKLGESILSAEDTFTSSKSTKSEDSRGVGLNTSGDYVEYHSAAESVTGTDTGHESSGNCSIGAAVSDQNEMLSHPNTMNESAHHPEDDGHECLCVPKVGGTANICNSLTSSESQTESDFKNESSFFGKRNTAVQLVQKGSSTGELVKVFLESVESSVVCLEKMGRIVEDLSKNLTAEVDEQMVTFCNTLLKDFDAAEAFVPEYSVALSFKIVGRIRSMVAKLEHDLKSFVDSSSSKIVNAEENEDENSGELLKQNFRHISMKIQHCLKIMTLCSKTAEQFATPESRSILECARERFRLLDDQSSHQILTKIDSVLYCCQNWIASGGCVLHDHIKVLETGLTVCEECILAIESSPDLREEANLKRAVTIQERRHSSETSTSLVQEDREYGSDEGHNGDQENDSDIANNTVFSLAPDLEDLPDAAPESRMKNTNLFDQKTRHWNKTPMNPDSVEVSLVEVVNVCDELTVLLFMGLETVNSLNVAGIWCPEFSDICVKVPVPAMWAKEDLPMLLYTLTAKYIVENVHVMEGEQIFIHPPFDGLTHCVLHVLSVYLNDKASRNRLVALVENISEAESLMKLFPAVQCCLPGQELGRCLGGVPANTGHAIHILWPGSVMGSVIGLIQHNTYNYSHLVHCGRPVDQMTLSAICGTNTTLTVVDPRRAVKETLLLLSRHKSNSILFGQELAKLIPDSNIIGKDTSTCLGNGLECLESHHFSKWINLTALLSAIRTCNSFLLIQQPDTSLEDVNFLSNIQHHLFPSTKLKSTSGVWIRGDRSLEATHAPQTPLRVTFTSVSPSVRRVKVLSKPVLNSYAKIPKKMDKIKGRLDSLRLSIDAADHTTISSTGSTLYEDATETVKLDAEHSFGEHGGAGLIFNAREMDHLPYEQAASNSPKCQQAWQKDSEAELYFVVDSVEMSSNSTNSPDKSDTLRPYFESDIDRHPSDSVARASPWDVHKKHSDLQKTEYNTISDSWKITHAAQEIAVENISGSLEVEQLKKGAKSNTDYTDRHPSDSVACASSWDTHQESSYLLKSQLDNISDLLKITEGEQQQKLELENLKPGLPSDITRNLKISEKKRKQKGPKSQTKKAKILQLRMNQTYSISDLRRQNLQPDYFASSDNAADYALGESRDLSCSHDPQSEEGSWVSSVSTAEKYFPPCQLYLPGHRMRKHRHEKPFETGEDSCADISRSFSRNKNSTVKQIFNKKNRAHSFVQISNKKIIGFNSQKMDSLIFPEKAMIDKHKLTSDRHEKDVYVLNKLQETECKRKIPTSASDKKANQKTDTIKNTASEHCLDYLSGNLDSSYCAATGRRRYIIKGTSSMVLEAKVPRYKNSDQFGLGTSSYLHKLKTKVASRQASVDINENARELVELVDSIIQCAISEQELENSLVIKYGSMDDIRSGVLYKPSTDILVHQNPVQNICESSDVTDSTAQIEHTKPFVPKHQWKSTCKAGNEKERKIPKTAERSLTPASEPFHEKSTEDSAFLDEFDRIELARKDHNLEKSIFEMSMSSFDLSLVSAHDPLVSMSSFGGERETKPSVTDWETPGKAERNQNQRFSLSLTHVKNMGNLDRHELEVHEMPVVSPTLDQEFLLLPAIVPPALTPVVDNINKTPIIPGAPIACKKTQNLGINERTWCDIQSVHKATAGFCVPEGVPLSPAQVKTPVTRHKSGENLAVPGTPVPIVRERRYSRDLVGAIAKPSLVRSFTAPCSGAISPSKSSTALFLARQLTVDITTFQCSPSGSPLFDRAKASSAKRVPARGRISTPLTKNQDSGQLESICNEHFEPLEGRDAQVFTRTPTNTSVACTPESVSRNFRRVSHALTPTLRPCSSANPLLTELMSDSSFMGSEHSHSLCNFSSCSFDEVNLEKSPNHKATELEEIKQASSQSKKRGLFTKPSLPPFIFNAAEHLNKLFKSRAASSKEALQMWKDSAAKHFGSSLHANTFWSGASSTHTAETEHDHSHHYSSDGKAGECCTLTETPAEIEESSDKSAEQGEAESEKSADEIPKDDYAFVKPWKTFDRRRKLGPKVTTFNSKSSDDYTDRGDCVDSPVSAAVHHQFSSHTVKSAEEKLYSIQMIKSQATPDSIAASDQEDSWCQTELREPMLDSHSSNIEDNIVMHVGTVKESEIPQKYTAWAQKGDAEMPQDAADKTNVSPPNTCMMHSTPEHELKQKHYLAPKTEPYPKTSLWKRSQQKFEELFSEVCRSSVHPLTCTSKLAIPQSESIATINADNTISIDTSPALKQIDKSGGCKSSAHSLTPAPWTRSQHRSENIRPCNMSSYYTFTLAPWKKSQHISECQSKATNTGFDELCLGTSSEEKPSTQPNDRIDSMKTSQATNQLELNSFEEIRMEKSEGLKNASQTEVKMYAHRAETSVEPSVNIFPEPLKQVLAAQDKTPDKLPKTGTAQSDIRYRNLPGTPKLKTVLAPTIVRSVLEPLGRLTGKSAIDRPLYIVHSVTGSVDLLKGLAAGLHVHCVGIQRTEQTPDCSVESMARFYCQALTQQDTFGRYRLAGYSYGGMVAFEIARQLQQEGNEVEMLIMLDGSPDYVRFQTQHTLGHLPPHASPQQRSSVMESHFLLYFLSMYGPVTEREAVLALLQEQMTQESRIEAAVCLSMGTVNIIASLSKRNWMELAAKLQESVRQGQHHQPRLSHTSNDVIRMKRHQKATEFIQAAYMGDSYDAHSGERFRGDIYLIRIKSNPEHTCPLPVDYGLGSLCTGTVHVVFVDGKHDTMMVQPCLSSVIAAVKAILNNASK